MLELIVTVMHDLAFLVQFFFVLYSCLFSAVLMLCTIFGQRLSFPLTVLLLLFCVVELIDFVSSKKKL